MQRNDSLVVQSPELHGVCDIGASGLGGSIEQCGYGRSAKAIRIVFYRQMSSPHDWLSHVATHNLISC